VCNAEIPANYLLPTVMRLIGMLDSPYVRRVAISLDFLAVPFEHEAVSVFSTFEQFQRINPVVKAPTLVCSNGDVLMDSSLILQFVEATMASGHSLWSRDASTLQREMRCVSLALAACDKSVQIVYERNLRPPPAQYEPWMERVRGQMLAAYAALEVEVASHPEVYAVPRSQACITTAVVWQFTQSMLAALVPATAHPAIEALAMRMEATAQFRKFPPVGPGV
jgi:glutathione S-transferase